MTKFVDCRHPVAVVTAKDLDIWSNHQSCVISPQELPLVCIGALQQIHFLVNSKTK
jgi:hypothetical protein